MLLNRESEQPAEEVGCASVTAGKMSQNMSYSTFRYHHCKDMFLPLAVVLCLSLTLFLLPLDVGV